MTIAVQQVVPIFRIFDEAKAREFYVAFLGLRSIGSTGLSRNRRCTCRSRAGFLTAGCAGAACCT